jgi:GNAT superfamily N-acetyltransferase
MVEIRACVITDFEQILPLLQQLWPAKTLCRQRLRAVYDRGLASDAQHYLCAVQDGRIAGFCAITLKNNLRVEGMLATLDEMVVHHADRGRGIGDQLIQAVVTFARVRGCVRVELESAFHRAEAHDFYQHRGFQKRAYHFSMPLV